MTAAEAARMGDDIGHTSAMSGLLWGIAAGLVIGAALVFTVATGGLGGVILGGLFVAGMGATGGLVGMAIGQRNEGNVKGKIGSGSPNVITVGAQQARVFLDFIDCLEDGTELIATGSSTVFVNGEMAARRNDQAECSGLLHTDQETVLIGGETAVHPELTLRPEVPEWLVTTLTVVAWVGGAAGGLLMVPIIGAVAATVSFAAGIVGGLVGGRVGRWIGSNWGEDGAFWGELIGGFTGGLLAGAGGARMGVATQSRLPPQTLAAMRGRTPAQIKARQDVLYRHLRRPVTREIRRSNEITARSYGNSRDGFRDHRPMSASDALSKVRGSDLTKPVRIRTTQRDEYFQQFRNQGRDDIGNWQAKHGITPDEVGLGEYGGPDALPKEVITVRVRKGTEVIESTAAPIKDTWSVTRPDGSFAPQRAPGGGQQTYVHYKDGNVTAVGPADGPPGTPPPRPHQPKGPPPEFQPPPPKPDPNAPPKPYQRPTSGLPQGAGTPVVSGVNPITGGGGAPSGGDP